ncbi:DoxX family protein [Haloactinomyces albus]|uniref:Oxidoreductase n=1 Tax=Haloactinomyces albus TaxID=1352928 RepID=A0AAE4CJF1_9ACTN|nr:DoxX family protein [Haloactinomyces albus]MDR7299905.1 putative oxidoreductase [Haloactinomyces albus]
MNGIRDLFALIGRLGIGAIFIAHGWQKLSQGIAGTAEGFAQLGVPQPQAAAWFTTIVELGGGIALVLGVALPLVGVLLAIDMAGALFLVHLPYGLLGQNGYELVLALGTASLALGFNGGRWTLDYAVLGRNRRSAPGQRAHTAA